ncbi:MAG: LysR family transcriptional regulator [Gemmataceae bacterium]
MELHQLRYFVAVAETGSFTRAAEREGVTQPTLSEQVMRLESKKHGVGRRLFDRLGRKVVLTDAGSELLGRAQSILAAVNEAERAIRDSAEGGRLRVGAIPTVAPFVLPGQPSLGSPAGTPASSFNSSKIAPSGSWTACSPASLISG